MSKVLMAFLGTNNYLPCNYYINSEKVSNVRFIQEAIASLFCKDWTENDRIVIFLTEEAKNTNWVNNGHKDGKPFQIEGLEQRLKSLGLKTKIIHEDISSGQNEEEIWEVFEKVYEQINEKDKVIFDITHALRSQPVLAIIILNYAEVLKNIEIKGLYYGAFEVLGTIREVEKMNIKDRNVPIFNLTSFVSLFNWTNAINNFLTYGDAEDIRRINQDKKEIKNVNDLTIQLEKFTKSIRTCRGISMKDFDFKKLNELIQTNKNGPIKPLNPLLDKISNKFEGFNNNDIKNGYVAVEWCIEHNLIQQGYTLLQETMKSEIVAECFGNTEITNKDNRELVTNSVTIISRKIPESEWNELAKRNKDQVKKIINYLNMTNEDFVKIYDSITQFRNDLNHGGFVQPTPPDTLKKNLKKYYEMLKRGAKDV